MVNKVKVEHVLILAIVAFLLYHFVGRCNCFNGNGFRVGGRSSFISGVVRNPQDNMWEDLKKKHKIN